MVDQVSDAANEVADPHSYYIRPTELQRPETSTVSSFSIPEAAKPNDFHSQNGSRPRRTGAPAG
jgi:hypothetical protein